MSLYQFFASDIPLKEVQNTSVEILSIEEAEKRHIQIDYLFTEDESIDRSEKLFLFCENEECLNEIEITEDNDSYNAKAYTEKQYVSVLSWKYSKSRAIQIIEYITEHLEMANEIEIWNIWLDEREAPVIKRCSLSFLSESDIKDIIGQDFFHIPECLVVEK